MQKPIKSSLAKELDAISEKTKEEGNMSGFEQTINVTMKMIHPQIEIVKTMMMLIMKMLMVLKKKMCNDMLLIEVIASQSCLG